MSAEMDRLVAEFEKFQSKIKQAEANFAKVGDLQDEVVALEATAMSPDRAVTVVAGPGGSVKDIRLTAEALRQQPQQLATTILSTLHRAVADAAVQQAGIVDAHVGAAFGLDVSGQVLEAQAEAMGTTAEELKSKASEAQPAPRRLSDEDLEHGDILRRAEPPAAPPPPPPARPADDGVRRLWDHEEDR
ncbi:YbaB/EbfC family nucleoid-associated protein [Amycolatopsis sp. DSM 110486]|uniref:YbaB/EbfC family nucleoid-associated protein n=1 Tax=Amycolatopsis sp. DSM 110486 TaxID=2865832 RepID=UPI001C69FBA5|nr:YbaB/EbfC family nucleoid-associated protein [Amycolatopsis sp. DSM 110486]QYN24844.1 YbaB/EbfC family nucleoid-associated protein [Amycolatopsis sp. DSM 110486]